MGRRPALSAFYSCFSLPRLACRRCRECDKDLQLLQEVRLQHRGDGRLLQKHGRGESSCRLRPADHLSRAAGRAQPGPQCRHRDAQCGKRYSRLNRCPYSSRGSWFQYDLCRRKDRRHGNLGLMLSNLTKKATLNFLLSPAVSHLNGSGWLCTQQASAVEK